MEVRNSSKRESSNINWTRDLTLKLIKLYRSHSNLWDASSAKYKNRNVRRDSLEKISRILGISIEHLNDKIHNLRCQFQSINRKKLKAESAQGHSETFRIKWEFYDALKFINGPNYNTQTEVDPLYNEENDSEEIQETQNVISQLKSERQSQDYPSPLDFLSSPASSHVATPSPSSSGASTPLPSTSRTPAATTKRKRETNKQSVNEVDQQVVLNRCLGVMPVSSNSFQIFGDYVADELRSMDSKAPDLQSQAKRKIQRIILDMNEMFDSRISTGKNNGSNVGFTYKTADN